MEKTEKILIGAVVIIAAISIIFFSFGNMTMNNPSGEETGVSLNKSFIAGASSDGKLISFIYMPADNLQGPFNAAYEMKKDNKTIFMDKKTFDSVSPDNPITIAFPDGGKATYTMYMIIMDSRRNPVHKSVSVLVIGNTTSFSSGTFIIGTPVPETPLQPPGAIS